MTEMLPRPDDTIERVLAVLAHPDDVDFGAAGTVAQWTAAGLTVSYCIITSGDAGGFDDTPRHLMAELRETEQRAAAEAVGVKDVVFLRYPDGRLTASHELRRDITRQIRRVRPQRVLCASPERNWDRIGTSHPDHLAAGEAALCAVYPDSRNPFAHPELLAEEGLAEWTVSEVWMMASPRALVNHAVDITETFDRKVAALRAHASQTARMPDLPGSLRQWLGAAAQAVGLPEGRLAEIFHVINTG